MTDPYKILGVDRSATDDEIKSAYRALAKKYHPDNYVNSPLADVAEEKMKEINEAYQQIQDERAGKSSGNSSYSSYGQTKYNTNTSDRSSHANDYIHIRELINAGRTREAENALNNIPVPDRNAEWNFLMGCILTQKGWYYEAQTSFDAACAMDPTNTEYANAQARMKTASQNYGRGYRTSSTMGTPDVCSICQTLICADCLCECCGGDLIPCC